MRVFPAKSTIRIIFITLILVVSVISVWVKNHIQQQVRQELYHTLDTVLDTTHQAVRTWANEQRSIAEVWANTEIVRSETRKLLASNRETETLLSSPAQQTLRKWLSAVQITRDFSEYAVITPDMTMLAASRNYSVGINVSHKKQNEFLQKLLEGKSTICVPLKSDISLPDKNGELRINLPSMFVGAPIKDDAGKVIAMLVFRFDPAKDFTALLQKGRIGQSGETYAFNREGRLISDSRFENQLRKLGLIRNDEHSILNIVLRNPGENLVKGETKQIPTELQAFTRMAASAVTGQSGSDLDGYRDYRGVPVVGVWRWDEELAFGIAIEMNKEEAYQTLNVTENVIMAFTLLVILLLSGLMTLLHTYNQRNEAIIALERLHGELEKKVKERSETLITANKELIVEVLDRQKAEEALQESEYMMQMLVTHSPIAIAMFDKDMRYIAASHRWKNDYKLGDREVRGKSHYQIFPEIPEKWRLVYQRGLKGEVLKASEDSFKRSDGTIQWIHWEVHPWYGREKEVEGIIIFSEDITAHKQTEEKLKSSGRELKGILESLQDVYYRTDSEGYILKTSPSVLQLTGYTSDELEGKQISLFWNYPEKRGEMLDMMRSKNGKVENYEVEGIHKNGNIVWGSINAHFYYDQKGNIAGIEGTIRDITVRREAEKALRESEERYRSLVELSPNTVVVHDLEGKILFANSAAVELAMADSTEQLINQSINKFIHPDFRDECAELIAKMISEQKPSVSHEQKFLTIHGTEIDVEVSGGPLIYDNKPAIQILARDITQRKKAEQKTLELLQQNRDLTQRNFQLQEEERQNIARELHDEFGQWLTAIQLDAQNILNLIGHQSEKVDESVESIVNSSKQIHYGIRRMIHSLRPALLDELGLKDSLHELVNLWRDHNPDVACQLKLDGELDTLGKILSINLYRLVQEGLTNVSKHAHATQVIVQLERKSGSDLSRSHVSLVIEDNGIGVDPDIISTGFGLPGMRERVLSLGGTFSINNVGNGHNGTRIKTNFVINTNDE